MTGRGFRLALGPALAVLVLVLGPGEDPRVARMAAVAAWMAAWWVTEAVPIPVTALLPLVFLPPLGLMPVRDVASNYARSTIFLFLGGFMLALGLQATGVHRRMALFIIDKVGGQPRRLLVGFMLASGLLSMWISNTATVMVLMPIGLSVLAAARDRGVDEAPLKRLGAAVMLSISYAASIGGMATLIGTPPNLSYKEQLVRLHPGAPPPSFASWMMLGLPLAAAFLVAGSFLFTRVAFRLGRESLVGSREAVAKLRHELGPLRRDEITAAAIFGATALLWMTRAPVEFGALRFPGWGALFGKYAEFLDDAVVAVAAAVTLFVVPSRDRPGERLLEWREVDKLPWGMLLVFGGGFALAAGFQSSGLSAWLGDQLAALREVPPLVLVAVICVAITFLTELTSNTATTEMVLPILSAAAVATQTDPRYLMIPATLSASCAFMMPVASPTQTIVFGSGWVPMREMVRAGIWFNLTGIVLVILVFWLLAGPAMGIDPGVLPAWAR